MRHSVALYLIMFSATALNHEVNQMELVKPIAMEVKPSTDVTVNIGPAGPDFVPSAEQLAAFNTQRDAQKAKAEAEEAKAEKAFKQKYAQQITEEATLRGKVHQQQAKSDAALDKFKADHKADAGNWHLPSNAADNAASWVPLPNEHPNAAAWNDKIRKAKEKELNDNGQNANGNDPNRNENANGKFMELQGGSFCWRDSYTRGVGTIPNVCSGTKSYYENGLCYEPCRAGYSGNAFLCWKECNSGYTTYAMTCTNWGSQYWKSCCCTIFGCCGCNSGYTDEGCSCRVYADTYWRDSYDRGIGVIPTGCPSGYENSGGLCYPTCNAGYFGNSFVCWQNCPATHSYGCGMGCSDSGQSCSSAVTDMVLGPILIVVDVALTVITAGGWAAASAAAKTAIKAAMKTMTVAGAKAAIQGATKESIKQGFKTVAKGLTEQVYEEMYITSLKGESVADWELENLCMLDPTGISGVVVAYAQSKCVVPPPPPRPAQCGYFQGCNSAWMGVGDGCDCNSAAPYICPDGDCFTKPCQYWSGCQTSYMGASDGCDCESSGARCADTDCY